MQNTLFEISYTICSLHIQYSKKWFMENFLFLKNINVRFKNVGNCYFKFDSKSDEIRTSVEKVFPELERKNWDFLTLKQDKLVPANVSWDFRNLRR